MALQQLLELWGKFSAQQRRTLVLLMLLSAGAIAGLVYWAQRPDYTVLYRDLAVEDAGEIVDYLRTHGYKYRLGAGGTMIEVDRADKYALRLSLAQEGLPKAMAGEGFSLFDKGRLPGSEFANQVSYQRALQGELERTINSLDKIQMSRVHIVLPRYDLYGGRQKASASVMVVTKGNQQLNSREVEGIVYLVAGAVEGLSPQAITVIDGAGNILNETGSGEGLMLTRKQIEARQAYEKELRHELQQLLDSSLGQNMSVVEVHAELDFDKEELTSHTLQPSSAQGERGLLQERETDEQYRGAPPRVGGVAGISGNIQAPVIGNTPAGGEYTSKVKERTYAEAWEDRVLVKAPGKVKRLTVAVIIDSELPPDTERQVTKVVSGAAGIDAARGDQVVVERMDLAAKQQAKDAEQAAEQQQGTAYY